MLDSNIYIDTPRKYGTKSGKWSHMICENTEKLHLYAKFLTISRSRYENKKGKGRPHYDIKSGKEFDSAVLSGAEEVSSKEIVKLLQQWNNGI